VREIAGEGAKPPERAERARERRSSEASGSGAGWRPFLKRDMGAPDSLQCLSGAHQTAHSSCPVNHRTAHRKGSSCARAAGAPDSAQFSVRCTPDCPVSLDRGKIWNFEFFYLVFNQTKSQLIITQNNTCWDRYWHPHIFSHNFQNMLP
jgi:hypothetical protein